MGEKCNVAEKLLQISGVEGELVCYLHLEAKYVTTSEVGAELAHAAIRFAFRRTLFWGTLENRVRAYQVIEGAIMRRKLRGKKAIWNLRQQQQAAVVIQAGFRGYFYADRIFNRRLCLLDTHDLHLIQMPLTLCVPGMAGVLIPRKLVLQVCKPGQTQL